MISSNFCSGVEFDKKGDLKYDDRLWLRDAMTYLANPHDNKLPGQHPDPRYSDWNEGIDNSY